MEKLELVFIPLPGIGHLVSTVELAKRVAEAEYHRFSITVLVMHMDMMPSLDSSTTSYVHSVIASGASIRFIDLPHVDFAIKDNQAFQAFLSLFVEAHKTHVKEAIAGLSSSATTGHKIGALIVDMFSTTLIDVGKELGVPTYVFYTSPAAVLGFLLYLPTLDERIDGDFKDCEGEIEVPGIGSFPATNLPPATMIKDDGFGWLLYHARRFRDSGGLIVNTFAELEPEPLTAIRSGLCLPDQYSTPPIYTVGPLIALEERPDQSDATKLMQWLDKQPESSVLFLCFGSMGTFSPPQVNEMAVALERCGHRFLWCIRSQASETFSMPTDADLNQILPPGFLDRTEGRGLVWPSWAPQVAVLSHHAVGGFVSHCGWNSCLESIWFGVPILAWPLYAEQRLNAFQMVRNYGLAVELKMDYEREDWVSSEDLERGVRCLMDSETGQKVRKKAKEMAEASRKAVKEGGSSYSSLALLADQFIRSAAGV